MCVFVFPRWWLIQHDIASMSQSVIICLRQISLNRAQRKGNHGVPVILIQGLHRWSWWKLWKKRKVQLWTFSHIPWPHSCPSSEKPDSRSDVQNQRNLLLVIPRDIDGQETELTNNDGGTHTYILLCGHEFLKLIRPPPLAHPGRSASAEANFPSTQLWITVHLSWFTLAGWVA